MKKVIQGIIELVLISGLIYYLYNHGDQFYRIKNIPIEALLLIIILIIIGNIISSLQEKYFIGIFGHEISYFNSFYLKIGCTLLNYFPFSFGSIIKAKGLKHYLGLNYSKFLSIYTVNILLTVISGSSIGFILLINRIKVYNLETLYALSFLVFCFTVPVMILFAKPKYLLERNEKILAYVNDYLKSIAFIKRNRIDVIILIMYVLLILFLIAFQFKLCFSSLGIKISYIDCTVFSVFTALLTIINITPASIGIREIIIGAFSASTGLSFEIGVIASGIHRVCSIIVHTSMGLPSLLILRKNKII